MARSPGEGASPSSTVMLEATDSRLTADPGDPTTRTAPSLSRTSRRAASGGSLLAIEGELPDGRGRSGDGVADNDRGPAGDRSASDGDRRRVACHDLILSIGAPSSSAANPREDRGVLTLPLGREAERHGDRPDGRRAPPPIRPGRCPCPRCRCSRRRRRRPSASGRSQMAVPAGRWPRRRLETPDEVAAVDDQGAPVAIGRYRSRTASRRAAACSGDAARPRRSRTREPPGR